MHALGRVVLVIHFVTPQTGKHIWFSYMKKDITVKSFDI